MVNNPKWDSLNPPKCRDLHKVFGGDLLINGQIETSARDQCEDAKRELLWHQVPISRTVESIFELSVLFIILRIRGGGLF